MVVLGILGLLISFSGLIIAFIAFLDKRNKRK
ncbi:putative holin-like toxin [Lacrimispora sp. 210928-DFI.3.58]